MEYDTQRKLPVTKKRRQTRRAVERIRQNAKEEINRQRSRTGGQPDELSITQGQNGEQGNALDQHQSRNIG
jgi:hypothetical protein